MRRCQIVKNLFVLILALFFMLSYVSVSRADMNNFLKETLDNMESLTPKAYQAQERGYFVGGSAHVAFPHDYVQPFSVTPPSLKMGCGGIDVVMGGFSYLNFDYLVQKLQSIMQMAPAFAFQLALKTLSEQTGGVLDALESFSSLINSLNFDACGVSQTLVTTTANALSTSMEKTKSAASSKQASGGSEWFGGTLSAIFPNTKQAWSDFKEDMKSLGGTSEQKYQIGLSLEVETSLLHEAFERLSGVPGDVEDAVRAVVGDAIPQQPIADEETEYISTLKGGCGISGEEMLENFATTGQIKVMSWNGACQDKSVIPLQERVHDMLEDMYNKLEVTASGGGASFTEEEKNLINSTRIPIYSFLKVASLSHCLPLATTTINNLSSAVAYDLAYATICRIERDIKTAVTERKSQLKKGGSVTAGAVNVADELLKEILKLKIDANRKYAQKIGESSEILGNLWEQYVQQKQFLFARLKQTGLYENYITGVKLKNMGVQ